MSFGADVKRLEVRIVEYESQLAEAQGKLDAVRLERRWLAAALIRFLDHRSDGCAPMYGCSCGAEDAAMFAARILEE